MSDITVEEVKAMIFDGYYHGEYRRGLAVASDAYKKQLAEATARADDAEGINLAVTEQMKIIASFTDNTASVKAKGIEEALHHVPFPQDMPSTDAALLAYDNNLLNYAKSLEGKQP